MIIEKVFFDFLIEIPDGLSEEDYCPEANFAGIEWRKTLVNRKAETVCPEGTVGNLTVFLLNMRRNIRSP